MSDGGLTLLLVPSVILHWQPAQYSVVGTSKYLPTVIMHIGTSATALLQYLGKQRTTTAVVAELPWRHHSACAPSAQVQCSIRYLVPVAGSNIKSDK